MPTEDQVRSAVRTLNSALPVLQSALQTLNDWFNPTPQPQPQPGQPETPIIPPIAAPGDAIQIKWNDSLWWDTRDHGGFACEQILVFCMDVPADAKPGRWAGRFLVNEYDGLPSPREIVLSQDAGSFDLANAITRAVGNTAMVSFDVGFNLIPGQRYYFNVRNWSPDLGNHGCNPGQIVNVRVNISAPGEIR